MTTELDNTWVIVLAGHGEVDTSSALRMAEAVVPRSRVLLVRSVSSGIDGVLEEVAPNVLVQPCDRGTAAGVLLPLLRIMARGPRAVVAVIPGTAMAHELPLRSAVPRALRAAERGSAVILALAGEAPGEHGGLVLPASEESDLRRVLDVVEDPDPEEAASLRERGALSHALVFAAPAERLLGLYHETVPDLLRVMLEAVRDETRGHAGAVEDLYRELPVGDFYRDVLQRSASSWSVLTVAPGGASSSGGIPARQGIREGDTPRMNDSAAAVSSAPREPRRNWTPPAAWQMPSLRQLLEGRSRRRVTRRVTA